MLSERRRSSLKKQKASRHLMENAGAPYFLFKVYFVKMGLCKVKQSLSFGRSFQKVTACELWFIEKQITLL